MKLLYRGKHEEKKKMSGLKLVAGLMVIGGIAIGAMILPGLHSAKAVALEKPRYAADAPVIASTMLTQQLVAPEDCQAAAESVVGYMESLVDKRPVYMRNYNDVGPMTVYLTIDDGPSKATSRILDILQQYQVKATFFMLEPAMNYYGAEVTRMAEEGHAVGMHGVSHKKNVVYANAESVVGEMLTGQGHISALTGITTPLFRPPYGSKPYMTDEYKEATAEAGLSMWDWNVDSLDWKFRSEAYVQHTINQLENLKAKGKTPVILIHDTEATADSLPLLLDYLLEQGYQFELADGETAPIQFP